jgi:putative ABC transport system permease protein
MLGLVGTIIGVIVFAFLALVPFFLLLFGCERLLERISRGLAPKFLLMMVKNLRRNLLRSSITYLVVFNFVIVVIIVWSVLHYLDALMTEKANNIKAIVTEKWEMSSQLPFTYAMPLAEGAADPNRPDDVRPQDSMTWQFYIGTLDPAKKTRDNFVFFIALEPAKLLTMMDEVMNEIATGQRQSGLAAEKRRELAEGVARMEQYRQGIIVGRKRLAAINRQVGDRFTLTGINYQKIDLEFEIVGVLPESGQYDEACFMNREYLLESLSAHERKMGQRHLMADKTLNVVWLKVADQHDYGRIAGQIETSGLFKSPAVKVETLSSAINTVMQSYRDLVFGMRWLLSPAVLVTMALVVANAISLSVRERRTELAVMKVLGFRPGQLLALVLGEAVLIGTISGLLSSTLSYVMVNVILRTVNPMPMAIPADALWWGPSLGGITAFAGSIIPALTACRVEVSEVFARVT